MAEDVEDHQRDRHFLQQSRGRPLPAQPLLKQREWKHLVVFERNNFTVDNYGVFELLRGFNNLRKLMPDIVQSARIQRGAAAGRMKLSADAVVFVLDIESA